MQTLGEFFSTVTRKLSPPLTSLQAERSLTKLTLTFRVVSLTAETPLAAVRASRQNQMSYWDALIWAAAKTNDIPIVLSEDGLSRPEIEGVRFVRPIRGGLRPERAVDRLLRVRDHPEQG